jgi:putative membrane protein
MMMNWSDYHMGWWGYAWMGVGMAVFWALVVVAIIAVVRFVADDRRMDVPPPTAPASAEQILAGRFARGEVSEMEYRERLAVLAGAPEFQGSGADHRRSVPPSGPPAMTS